eukprot:CAMPEP_0204355240 /NCGR_PEP_ID=MMETSP0469-20131031/33991_1 /ASSEMBLY_ACC=CAM_ASM_000384 /TAXON_ID=2969 /ORGANISM="Oxyrrhis marina" /LENGTH=1126 /DNA_ID=CAMNT_0051342451 /DNA_START=40 /DNA_END=3420 /DNA_ORIENTATION=-
MVPAKVDQFLIQQVAECSLGPQELVGIDSLNGWAWATSPATPQQVCLWSLATGLGTPEHCIITLDSEMSSVAAERICVIPFEDCPRLHRLAVLAVTREGAVAIHAIGMQQHEVFLAPSGLDEVRSQNDTIASVHWVGRIGLPTDLQHVLLVAMVSGAFHALLVKIGEKPSYRLAFSASGVALHSQGLGLRVMLKSLWASASTGVDQAASRDLAKGFSASAIRDVTLVLGSSSFFVLADRWLALLEVCGDLPGFSVVWCKPLGTILDGQPKRALRCSWVSPGRLVVAFLCRSAAVASDEVVMQFVDLHQTTRAPLAGRSFQGLGCCDPESPTCLFTVASGGSGLLVVRRAGKDVLARLAIKADSVDTFPWSVGADPGRVWGVHVAADGDALCISSRGARIFEFEVDAPQHLPLHSNVDADELVARAVGFFGCGEEQLAQEVLREIKRRCHSLDPDVGEIFLRLLSECLLESAPLPGASTGTFDFLAVKQRIQAKRRRSTECYSFLRHSGFLSLVEAPQIIIEQTCRWLELLRFAEVAFSWLEAEPQLIAAAARAAVSSSWQVYGLPSPAVETDPGLAVHIFFGNIAEVGRIVPELVRLAAGSAKGLLEMQVVNGFLEEAFRVPDEERQQCGSHLLEPLEQCGRRVFQVVGLCGLSCREVAVGQSVTQDRNGRPAAARGDVLRVEVSGEILVTCCHGNFVPDCPVQIGNEVVGTPNQVLQVSKVAADFSGCSWMAEWRDAFNAVLKVNSDAAASMDSTTSEQLAGSVIPMCASALGAYLNVHRELHCDAFKTLRQSVMDCLVFVCSGSARSALLDLAEQFEDVATVVQVAHEDDSARLHRRMLESERFKTFVLSYALENGKLRYFLEAAEKHGEDLQTYLTPADPAAVSYPEYQWLAATRHATEQNKENIFREVQSAALDAAKCQQTPERRDFLAAVARIAEAARPVPQQDVSDTAALLASCVISRRLAVKEMSQSTIGWVDELEVSLCEATRFIVGLQECLDSDVPFIEAASDIAFYLETAVSAVSLGISSAQQPLDDGTRRKLGSCWSFWSSLVSLGRQQWEMFPSCSSADEQAKLVCGTVLHNMLARRPSRMVLENPAELVSRDPSLKSFEAAVSGCVMQISCGG